MKQKERFYGRAQTVFARHTDSLKIPIEAMIAEHASRGILVSGSTIVRSIEMFEEDSREALTSILSEAAKIIEHRGRDWNASMDGIAEALNAHLSNARTPLARPIQIVSQIEVLNISGEVDQLLTQVRARLQQNLDDFRDGWTAPVPKLWKDRHPTIYAGIFLLVGGVIGALGTILTKATIG